MLRRKQQESCAKTQLWADPKKAMQGREVECALWCVHAFIGHLCLCVFAEAETQGSAGSLSCLRHRKVSKTGLHLLLM